MGSSGVERSAFLFFVVLITFINLPSWALPDKPGINKTEKSPTADEVLAKLEGTTKLEKEWTSRVEGVVKYFDENLRSVGKFELSIYKQANIDPTLMEKIEAVGQNLSTAKDQITEITKKARDDLVNIFHHLIIPKFVKRYDEVEEDVLKSTIKVINGNLANLKNALDKVENPTAKPEAKSPQCTVNMGALRKQQARDVKKVDQTRDALSNLLEVIGTIDINIQISDELYEKVNKQLERVKNISATPGLTGITYALDFFDVLLPQALASTKQTASFANNGLLRSNCVASGSGYGEVEDPDPRPNSDDDSKSTAAKTPDTGLVFLESDSDPDQCPADEEGAPEKPQTNKPSKK